MGRLGRDHPAGPAASERQNEMAENAGIPGCYFDYSGCTGGGGGTGEGAINIGNPLGEGTQFQDIVGRLIDFIFKIAIVLAPLMIVFGAFLFVTSAGDLQKINRAKSLMIWTVVGFIIVLLAKGLLAMLESFLGVAVE